jgi:CRISPR-associated protein Csx17
VDRGIAAFQRFAIVRGRVGGENYNTSAVLGCFEVRARPDVDLLREADGWLGRFRGAASDEKAPPRFRSALRRIEGAIFDFCQHGGTPRFAEILCALGRAERELAGGENFRKDSNLSPLAGLSLDWLRAANDESFEYELALSLAGVHDRERVIGPLRANLESVTWPGHPDWKGYTSWAERSRAVVWSSANLSANLVAILERRLMDGDRNGCSKLPLASWRSTSLDAVSAFLAGAVDDARVEDLLWGLLLVDHGRPHPIQPSRPPADAPPLPRAYALLKLLFLPDPLATKAGEVRVRPEPSLVPLLRAGHIGDACALAMRRLRASGLLPTPYRTGGRAARDDEWRDAAGSVEAQRLAAALLFPVSLSDVTRLTALVLRPGEAPH